MTKDEISNFSVTRKIVFITRKLIFAALFFILPILSNDTITQTYAIVPKSLENYVNVALLIFVTFIFIRDEINFRKNSKRHTVKADKLKYRLIKITEFLYSSKTQKEIFEPCLAEWEEEINEALRKNKDASLFMINVRNTYGFLAAMWQKSPIGDLIEFIRKFAK